MKIKKLCNRLIKNIKIAVVSDNLRRKLLFYFLNAALSLTSFIMTIINIFTKEHILMFATLLFAVLCLLNIILLYFSTTYKNERRCRSFFCLFRYFVLQSNRLKHFVIALFAYIKAVLSSVFFGKISPCFFYFIVIRKNAVIYFFYFSAACITYYFFGNFFYINNRFCFYHIYHSPFVFHDVIIQYKSFFVYRKFLCY